MATMAVTNDSGITLNALQQGGYGVSADAVGGNVANPLPYPFNANGELDDGDTLTLGVNLHDLFVRQQMQQPELPQQEWDLLIQKGWLSVSYSDVDLGVEDALVEEIG